MTAATLRSDPRIDAYIEQAPPFAQPILAHLRAAVHRACPDVEETIKWSRPHFLLDGQMFAGMSAFKAHCAFGFWHREGGAVASLPAPTEPAMGHFGRIESVADLPEVAALRQLIEQAARESREAREARKTGLAPPAPRPRREALPLPDDLAAALKTRARARAAFDAFTPSQRRDYIEWIVEAKREATRTTRIAQALEWIGEGKTRHWKYQDC